MKYQELNQALKYSVKLARAKLPEITDTFT